MKLLKLLYIPLAVVILLTAWMLFNRIRFKHILSPTIQRAIQVDNLTGKIRIYYRDDQGEDVNIGNILFE